MLIQLVKKCRFLHQSFIYIQQTLHLILQEPGGVVVLRCGFDDFEKAGEVFLRLVYHAEDLLAGQAPGHGREVVYAVEAFDEGCFGIGGYCLVVFVQDLRAGLGRRPGTGEKEYQFLSFVADREVICRLAAVFYYVVEQACSDDAVVRDVHG